VRLITGILDSKKQTKGLEQILFRIHPVYVVEFESMHLLSERIWQGVGCLLFLFTVTFYARQMTAWTRWQEWSVENIRHAFDPGAGEDRIRSEVLQMQKLAQRSAHREFKLHGELNEDQWIRYPAHEFLYPIRISEKSAYVFSKKGDEIQLPDHCTQLDFEGEVGLYGCS
jgi:hypothetical protein